MATEITMPQLSDTMDEGTILSWLKKEGDTIERGDELAEVGTDKADLPVESFNAGVLLKIYAAEGTTVKVGEVIAVIGEAGESVPDSKSSSAASPAEAAKPTEASTQTEVAQQPAKEVASPPLATPTVHSNGSAGGERIKASPLAKNIAQSRGVDLSSLSGTGEGGRIVKRDVEAALSTPSSAQSTPQVSVRPPTPITSLQAATQPLSKMRQTIASRMVEATTTIPHFYLTSAIDASGIKNVRASLKKLPEYEGVTFNHLIIKAVALTLRKFPRINSFYSEGNLVQPGNVNIGIITAVEDGLLIPVVKSVESLHLVDIVSESRALVNRARSGRPKGDDLVGATFCISNVGAFAVESFTAVISPGNGAILAVGAIQDEVVPVDGNAAIRPIMRVTLSVDHRIIDGVMGAEFLTELKTLLEDPVLLLA